MSGDCDKMLDRVYEFLNRCDVTPEEEAAFKKHLAECPPCGDKFLFEQKLLERLKAAGTCCCPENLKNRIQSLLD
jgi:anti-sigma factor (TIGR02949 family)